VRHALVPTWVRRHCRTDFKARALLRTLRDWEGVRQLTPRARRELGAKIANLVFDAELKFPGANTGPVKRAWVINEARKQAPTGTGPSHDFGQWAANHLLRLGIEIAVALLHRLRDQLPDQVPDDG